MRRYLLIALGAVLFLVPGCASLGGTGESPGSTPDSTPELTPDLNQPDPTSPPAPEIPGDVLEPEIITGTIELEDGSTIAFELYYNIAPQSVRNFVNLAQDGYYDGLRFHRIMPGFMIQGGCPFSLDFSGSPGTGNPGYSIFGEFNSNGFENNLSHTRGVMSKARGGHDFNSAGSQFFICHGDPLYLDGDYAAFGRVTDGMDVVDSIADKVTPPGGVVAPGEMPIIRTITIDGDVSLPEPDKLRR